MKDRYAKIIYKHINKYINEDIYFTEMVEGIINTYYLGNWEGLVLDKMGIKYKKRLLKELGTKLGKVERFTIAYDLGEYKEWRTRLIWERGRYEERVSKRFGHEKEV